MRFKGLDLNLLIALDLLLDERNVTRAAQRMHVGQSGMSAALSRLRLYFDDELLAVSGRRMIPTALGEALRQPLREAIIRLEALVDVEREFAPQTSTRHFKVEIPDHLVPVLLPALTHRLATGAPHVLLEVRPPSGDPTLSLRKGELDLVVTPGIYADPDYIIEPLLINDLALVGWRGNASLGVQPDLETVLSLKQVIVKSHRVRLASLLNHEQLELYSGSGRVALIAPDFHCIPPCLVGTNWITLVYRQFAILAAREHPLVIWDVPIVMPEMPEVMVFHPTRSQDGGLLWLRNQMRAAATDAGALVSFGAAARDGGGSSFAGLERADPDVAKHDFGRFNLQQNPPAP